MTLAFARCLLLAASLLAATSVQAQKILAVPNVTIYPGDVIGDEQIVERAFSDRAAGRFAAIEERALLVGKVARRTLLPGKPVPHNSIKDADVVGKGGTVLAIFRAGGLTITSHVTPLRAGGIGDVIEARNPDSGRIIRGEVQADGTLLIGGLR